MCDTNTLEHDFSENGAIVTSLGLRTI